MKQEKFNSETLIFAERFREILKDVNITQKEFASMINYSTTAVNNLVKGKSRITPSTAALICNAVNALGKKIEMPMSDGESMLVTYTINQDWLTRIHVSKFLDFKEIADNFFDVLALPQVPAYITVEKAEDEEMFNLHNSKTKKSCQASRGSISRMIIQSLKIEEELWNSFFDIQNNE